MLAWLPLLLHAFPSTVGLHGDEEFTACGETECTQTCSSRLGTIAIQSGAFPSWVALTIGTISKSVPKPTQGR